MDAFDVLGLSPSFDLRPEVLERRYRDLQRALHPDRFATAAATERRASLARAVTVNDAYRTLRDELKRAELLIVRHGGDTSERPAQADPALLMEVMELREALQDTKAGNDTVARARLVAEVSAKKDDATRTLREALAQAARGDQAGRDRAAAALSRLRYYRRFLDEVGVLEDALD
jgi:molecular chaperone HscB